MNRRAVTGFVGILAAAATAATIVAGRYPVRGHATWAALPALAVLIVAAEYYFIRFQLRGHVNAWNLVDTVLAPLIVGFPAPAVVVTVLVAQIAAAALRRNEPVKAAFNVAQWTFAAGVGTLVFGASGGRHGPPNLVALTAALVAVALVNNVAFIIVMSLATGQPLRRVSTDLAPNIATNWTVGGAANIAIGLLFAASYVARPVTVVLFAVPLAILRWASVAYGEARADRNRLDGLQRATHALTQPVNPLEAIPAFLAEVRDCFEVEVVDLMLVDDVGRFVHRLAGSGPSSYTVQREDAGQATLASVVAERDAPVRVSAASVDLALAGRLRVEGWRDCLGAPLSDGDERLGALCTYNRAGLEGFEDGELAVFEAVASEMASTLRRATLVQAILEERAKLDQIVNRTSDGIATVLGDGTVSSWNAGMEAISGYDADTMVGSARLALLRPHGPDGADVLLERWDELVEPLPETLRILTRSGDTRCLACSYSRAAAPDGGSMLIIVARDVTEAQKLAQLKEDLIATVSHEFRTPLVPIKGWAQMLAGRGEELDADQRQLASRTILRHAVRLEQLVVNFLEVAKVERDIRETSTTELEIGALTQRVAAEFRTSHPDREIVVRSPRRVRAIGQGVWVEQILSNLVANALKYSPADAPVELAVSESHGTVEVAVIDHGAGIAPADVERAFERFERLDSPVQSGTGLGLYIARQLATAIGATVTLESEVGRGCVFSLRLRAARQVRIVN